MQVRIEFIFNVKFLYIIIICYIFHTYISDENIYNNLTEDDVINVLHNITEEYFLLIKNELKITLEN